jgi:hypothetical protein
MTIGCSESDLHRSQWRFMCLVFSDCSFSYLFATVMGRVINPLWASLPMGQKHRQTLGHPHLGGKPKPNRKLFGIRWQFQSMLFCCGLLLRMLWLLRVKCVVGIIWGTASVLSVVAVWNLESVYFFSVVSVTEVGRSFLVFVWWQFRRGHGRILKNGVCLSWGRINVWGADCVFWD